MLFVADPLLETVIEVEYVGLLPGSGCWSTSTPRVLSMV